jgi:TonB-dependent receptor
MHGIGILSGGVFYKSLKDIIYLSTFEEAGGPYDGFEVTQPVNGDKATLLGVEVNWQQQFTFLPGFWSGFGIYANYTYTDSKADLTGRDDTVLPGQAGNVGNFALTYEKYGFQGRLSFAYYGEYIYEVGETPEEDIYYDKNLRIDFNASQQITRNLQAYLQFVNLSDTPLRYYIGDTNRPIQREFYSWWTQLGLRFNL